MINLINEISDSMFLVEMFDTEYELTPSRRYIDREYDTNLGISDHKSFMINDGDHGELHTWKSRSAVEIHHVDENGVSEILIPHGVGANPKFVATVLNLAKQHLDQGSKVRIVGKEIDENGNKTEMFNRYNRLTNKLAKKHDWFVTEPSQYKLGDTVYPDTKEITVSRIKDGLPHVHEIRREIIKNRIV